MYNDKTSLTDVLAAMDSVDTYDLASLSSTSSLPVEPLHPHMQFVDAAKPTTAVSSKANPPRAPAPAVPARPSSQTIDSKGPDKTHDETRLPKSASSGNIANVTGDDGVVTAVPLRPAGLTGQLPRSGGVAIR